MTSLTKDRTSRSEGESVVDRLLLVLALLAFGFIAFVGGAFVVLQQWAPGQFLANAYEGTRALYYLSLDRQSPLISNQWFPARRAETGVTVYDPTRAVDGYTLFTTTNGSIAQLVNMRGEVVHEWQVAFSDILDETSSIENQAPDEFGFLEKAHLFPNGDLLAVMASVDTPYGYGLVKLDANSNVVWKYLERVHHDVEPGADGRIYTLTHRINQDNVPDRDHLKGPRIDDYLAVLSPEGQELQRVSILDAFLDTEFESILTRTRPGIPGDLLHANAIQPIEGDLVDKMPFPAANTVLISLREIDALAAISLDTGKVVWMLRGSWVAQHDPDILPNGNILLFDNLGGFAPDNHSRVLEVDPRTGGVVWSYRGTPEHPFDSFIRGSQERLANGNTLITESTGSRVFEVTPEGDIVWEYLSPVREASPADPSIMLSPTLSRAKRFAPEDLEFVGY
ncbi:arylsulfotransferase family protein [Marinivivus vitaminiproducens]|uniref:arylsulfotransferase family protein n=1 Tax=Marinivivus vitaminiproducens TaxID=3035935 RepID=UPI0027A59005|nr:arylsulfotransferase family protein [Geminicoccaceae bacterium SCSIO 64248]